MTLAWTREDGELPLTSDLWKDTHGQSETQVHRQVVQVHGESWIGEEAHRIRTEWLLHFKGFYSLLPSLPVLWWQAANILIIGAAAAAHRGDHNASNSMSVWNLQLHEWVFTWQQPGAAAAALDCWCDCKVCWAPPDSSSEAPAPPGCLTAPPPPPAPPAGPPTPTERFATEHHSQIQLTAIHHTFCEHA